MANILKKELSTYLLIQKISHFWKQYNMSRGFQKTVLGYSSGREWTKKCWKTTEKPGVAFGVQIQWYDAYAKMPIKCNTTKVVQYNKEE